MAFAIFTVLVSAFDVQPIGPEGSEVGFAVINRIVHQQTGVNMLWYHITEWLGVSAVLFAFGFALLGLYQLVAGKSFRKVDRSVLSLGAVYILLMIFYLSFEWVVINYRPVLMEGVLEASYPSSHIMLVVCVMATTSKAVHILSPNRRWLCRVTDIFCALTAAITVAGRLLSGVHWFTDIVGGLLLASALIMLYLALVEG